MKAKLIIVLRETDNNQSTTELATYFKDIDLIMKPQREMRIRIGEVEFYIDYIVQDLNSKIIYLYEYKDIHYRYNRNDEGFIKESELLSNDGWKIL